MRNSRKNSIIRGLTAVLAVLLIATFMLAGCADKNAQAAADAANKAAQDAATKAEANKEAISKLPTEEKVAAAIKTLLADYAAGKVEGTDLVTAAELTAFLSSDELAEVLADYALGSDVDALKTKLNEYVTIAALETDYAKKAAVTGEINTAITALKTALFGEAAEAVKVATSTDLSKVAADLDVAEEKLAKLDGAATAIADLQKAFTDYAEATPEVVALILALEEKFAAVDSTKYSNAYLAELGKKVDAAKYTLLRATTKTEANAVYSAIVDELAKTPTFAQQLAELLDTYTEKNLFIDVVLGENQVKACEDLIAEATTKGVYDTLTTYVVGEGTAAVTRNLVTETNDFKAFYEWLDNDATALNAAIVAAIAANKTGMLCVDLADVDALEAAVNAVDIAAWSAYYDAKVSADPDAITKVKDYTDNKGIENAAESVKHAIADLIVGEENYKTAVDTLAALRAEQDEAADLNNMIQSLARTAGFQIKTDVYGYLYTYGDQADDLAADVADWAKAANVPNEKIAILITNNGTLNNMVDYIDEMEIKHEEAKKFAADVEAVKTLWTTNGKVTLADKAVVENALNKLNAWVLKPTENGVYVDMNNAQIMFTSNDSLTYFWMVHDTMRDLVAAEINAKIDALLAEKADFTILTMEEEIRPLRNEIVTWLNTYTVKVVAATPIAAGASVTTAEWIAESSKATDVEYAVNTTDDIPAYPLFNLTFAGYDKINTAKFDEIIAAYDAIVAEILSDVDTFLDAVDAIGAGPILYQVNNIEAAQEAYINWTKKHHLESINFEKIDMGETYAEDAAEVVAAYIKLVASKTKFDTTLAAAQADFAKFEALLEKVNAMTEITVLSSDIPALGDALMTWVLTYLDVETGYTADLADIDDIMTKAQYEKYIAQYNIYNALVKNAIADGNDIKADIEAADLTKADIEALEKAIADWFDKYDITLADLAKADKRLLGEGRGSINMVKVDADIKALRADYNAKMKAIADSIAAIPGTLTADNADAYKAAVKAAEDAIKAYITANGNNNGSDVTNAQLKALYTAKINVAAYDAAAAINADATIDAAKKATIVADYNSAAAIEVAAINALSDGTEKEAGFASYARILALLEENFETIKADHLA